ncbi:class I SAM-dependent methyltransferase [Rhodoplanes azumiensis]|uniref:Class I SAM-dependent methyltransferase n=1 Tax=Rhodoplanes azumiensis TaxID=1897628 RepID=A0ABW5ARE4_9BRAD
MTSPLVSPLADLLRRKIADHGPLPLAEWMAVCLGHPEHGYYATRDPLGRAGDFVTAPEISQMFGEVLGLWAAAVWQQMGAPVPVRLVELGPGRGTMMADILRAARVLPGFRAALRVHLVETSPVLAERQRESLAGAGVPIAWHRDLGEVPDGPTILVANEFFDAFPVHQAEKTRDGWCERQVGLAPDGGFALRLGPADPNLAERIPEFWRVAPSGTLFEWRDEAPVAALARRVAAGGAALVIDYGHVDQGPGETLQAMRGHAFADPFSSPGEADLTAHVDFVALAATAGAAGAAVHGPVTQASLLKNLGIEARAAALKATNPDRAAEIDAALARLVDTKTKTGMGGLFKAIGLADPALGPLPGLIAGPTETAP